MSESRLITIAIHTYDRASQLRVILESEGIPVTLQNVNLTSPSVSAGVRLRIAEEDLPRALRLIESIQIISPEIKAEYPQGGPMILVPTDFSESSLATIRTAFALAVNHNARLLLLHSYLDPGLIDTTSIQLSDTLTFPSTLKQQLEIEEEHAESELAGKQMDRLAAQIRAKIALKELPDVRFDTKVCEGLPEEVISEINSTLHPILIVMGTNSSDAESRALSGSIAGEVLNAADSTVLTIPQGKTFDPSAKMHAVFFSTSRQDDILALDVFARLFAEVKIDVTLVSLPSRRHNATDGTDFLLDYCRGNYPGFNFSSDSLSADKPDKDFERINSMKEVSLIIFPNRRKNVIARMFSPTLAHRLLFNMPLPLLAISLD